MSSVQVEQKSYEMPPRDGFTVTHFITVADVDRRAMRTDSAIRSPSNCFSPRFVSIESPSFSDTATFA
jgi:hypothetical protein